MSREAFEAWYAKNDRGVISSTPKEDAQQLWQAAQADAYERAAKEADHWQQISRTGHACGEVLAHVIRALAK